MLPGLAAVRYAGLQPGEIKDVASVQWEIYQWTLRDRSAHRGTDRIDRCRLDRNLDRLAVAGDRKPEVDALRLINLQRVDG